jgi:hypothetical protein
MKKLLVVKKQKCLQLDLIFRWSHLSFATSIRTMWKNIFTTRCRPSCKVKVKLPLGCVKLQVVWIWAPD